MCLSLSLSQSAESARMEDGELLLRGGDGGDKDLKTKNYKQLIICILKVSHTNY